MSDELRDEWGRLRDKMVSRHDDIERGRMMSADALTYKGKVFVFFSTKGGRVGLGCRIGRDTDLTALALSDWQHLAPFKTKPPMKDWIVVGARDMNRWSDLAHICLEKARDTGRAS